MKTIYILSTALFLLVLPHFLKVHDKIIKKNQEIIH
ncbi:MAG: hypothetical protein BWX63_01584 [Bacteroidetes bacterium ADurb.Bin041]|nr:MAG: hypothetical protein BWX63_01584 [Bacteroidetes bacterium ADurb.Bin041]